MICPWCAIAVHQEPTRISPALPRRLTLIPLKEEAISSERRNRTGGSLKRLCDSVAARELSTERFLVRVARSPKSDGNARKNAPVPVSCDVTRRESDSGPLRANRRIVIHYPIWRSQPSSLKGSLIATSQSGRSEEATTSMANLRSVMSTIKWGTKCVSGIACCKDLGAIVLPFRHSVPACVFVCIASPSPMTRAVDLRAGSWYRPRTKPNVHLDHDIISP